MAANVSVPSTRIKAHMSQFLDQFQNRNKMDDIKMLNQIMGRYPSKNNARTETFVILEDAPPFKRWDEAAPRQFGTFSDLSFDVEILKWQNAIEWARIDEEDFLSRGTLKQRCAQAGKKAALLDIEVFFQMVQGLTDADRLPSVPNAADGQALFSASRALFGASGNVVTGSGITTVAGIRNSFFEAREVLDGLVDTHGDLYHNDSAIDSGVVLLFGRKHEERVSETFEAKVIAQGGAGVENIVSTVSRFGNVTLWPTSRIATDDMYLILKDYPYPPIFALERPDLGDLEQIYVDERNSDYCRENDKRQIVHRFRRGYGISLPLAAVKISNS